MSTNAVLNRAKEAQIDEYYTRLQDVEREVSHYEKFFYGKSVLCNCDDPRVSNFFRYFALNFQRLGLKKLVSTCYKSDNPDKFANETEQACYILHDGSYECNCETDFNKLPVIPLKGNGDYRSPECMEMLREADIICTNPPFSLLQDFIKTLLDNKKEFLIIGNPSAIHSKVVFPYLRDNKMWIGYKPMGEDMLFNVPKWLSDELVKIKKVGSGYKIVDGEILGRSQAIWYTNLDTNKRHYDFVKELVSKYDPEKYPKYDNFDGIHVDKIENIPFDYYGNMGVPDNFMEFYNPEQFELLGISCGDLAKEVGVTKNYRGRTDLAYTKNGKSVCPYSRLIIRRKA